jgi:peptide/nickel transport system substrate-binding protein
MTQQPAALAALRDDIVAGRLTRRVVLARAVASGLTAPLIAGLLAACGDDDDTEPAPTVTASPGPGGASVATPTTAETGSTPAGVEPTATATSSASSATTATAPGRGRGSGELLRLLIWQAPTSLNTHFSQGDKDGLAARLVLEPLVNVLADGTLEPVLAAEAPSLENGGIAEDGRSVTWKLKQRVVWSDGQPFTAEDVQFTWEFVTNPDVAATTFATYDTISDVEVVDEHTVTFRFAEPNPGWSTIFSGSFGGAVLPKHVLEGATGTDARSAEFNLSPIGTGPYRVSEFRPGDTVLYEINESYREPDKPFFARVELKGGGDATSAARAVLLSGETDYAWNLQIEKAVAEDLAANAETGVLVATPGNSVEQLLINFADPNEEVDGARSEPTTQHPFFSDKVVRDALRLATDRETIATELYGEAGSPTANILVAPTSFNSPNTTVEFDPDAAAALLDDGGWTLDGDVRAKDGQKLRIVYTTTVNPLRQKTQEILKQAWEKIGISVELKAIDAAVYFDSSPGNPDTVAHFYADVTMFTNGPSGPFPLDYMAGFKSNEPETDIAQQSNQWSGNNYSRWVNEEFNDLWLAASIELDPVRQAELFIAMNDLVVAEIVRIGLVHRNGLSGYSKRIRGHVHSSWELAVYDIANWYAEE